MATRQRTIAVASGEETDFFRDWESWYSGIHQKTEAYAPVHIPEDGTGMPGFVRYYCWIDEAFLAEFPYWLKFLKAG